MTKVEDLTMIQINTDGITVRIPVYEKRHFYNLCKEWEKETGLILEYVAYKKMIIRDVNNYMGLYMDGKVKYKGTFKTYEQTIKDEEYHKSLSQTIVAEAVAKYFLEDIPVEKTIMECENIFDFCKTFNTSHGWKSETCDFLYEEKTLDEIREYYENKGWIERYIPNFYTPPESSGMAGVMLEKIGNRVKIYYNIEPQQKTNRYYISTNGKIFRKIKDDKIIEIEAGGKLVTIFNKKIDLPMDDYNIDYDYYINECYKIIHVVDGTEERMMLEAKIKKEEEKKQKEEEKFLKYCINKVPTERQLNLYGKDWLIEKYGKPKTK